MYHLFVIEQTVLKASVMCPHVLEIENEMLWFILQMARVCWFFYMSKFIELLDTVSTVTVFLFLFFINPFLYFAFTLLRLVYFLSGYGWKGEVRNYRFFKFLSS